MTWFPVSIDVVAYQYKKPVVFCIVYVYDMDEYMKKEKIMEQDKVT